MIRYLAWDTLVDEMQIINAYIKMPSMVLKNLIVNHKIYLVEKHEMKCTSWYLLYTRISGRQAAPHSSCSLRPHHCGRGCVDFLQNFLKQTDRQTEHSFIIVEEHWSCF